MYINLSSLSLLVIGICAATLSAQRSSPLQVEKDTAVYTFLRQYHHYTELDRALNQWSQNYSKIAEVVEIGKSISGRSLFAMHLTSPLLNTNETELDEKLLLKPKFKWIANMHGDETVGREVMLALIYYLLLNSKSDARVNRLLSTTDLYIMPTMNPDGFERSAEGTCDSGLLTGRGNLQTVDLNRDFPSQYTPLEKLSNGSTVDLFYGRQPETIAVMKWILKENFVLSANLHGGSLVASYPYDETMHHTANTYGESPDDSLFRYLARTYAEKHLHMSNPGGCFGEFPGGITNGAKWYDVSGGMQDFNYLHSNAFEITVELSCCKYPSAKEGALEKEWDNNKEALLSYMEKSHLGVKGFIRDAETHTGISGALIQVEGILHPVRSLRHGVYWRLLLPGLHNITVTASGYVPQTKYNIRVTNENSTDALRLDFDLQRANQDPSSLTKDVSSLNDIFNFLSDNADKLMQETREDLLRKLREPTEQFHYHNYQSMVDKLKEINRKYPNITSLYTIGKSHEKRDLWVMIVSDQPLVHEAGEPEMKYVANIHGDEGVGRECLLLFIEYLCINYGKNDYITQLVDNVRIHIMPTMNPDGFEAEYKQTQHAQGLGRLNAHHIDLNRNFPKVELESVKGQTNVKAPTEKQQNASSRLNKLTNSKHELEPEVRAVMHWSLVYPFVLSGSLHGGALVANYPYDERVKDSLKTESKSPDDQTFQMLAKAYSHAHPTMSKGTSCVKFNDGITNGAAWYVIEGGMQDWSYAYTSDMEVTIELGCTKYPEERNLKTYWDDNKGALLAFMTQVVHGVRGFAYDAKTKVPLSGVVIHVHDIQHNVTTYRDGDYFRILTPGVYRITAERLGYQPETKDNVLVGNQSSTYVEFHLKHQEYVSELQHQYAFSTFVNESSSNVQTFYHRAKNFVLHRTVFLLFAGIFALLVAILFAALVIYLRCCQGSTVRSQRGFQRYEALVQEENDSPFVGRVNGRKSNHRFASDSEDEDSHTIFSSKANKAIIP